MKEALPILYGDYTKYKDPHFDQSIHDFVSERIPNNSLFLDTFIDSMMSGIWAGNI